MSAVVNLKKNRSANRVYKRGLQKSTKHVYRVVIIEMLINHVPAEEIAKSMGFDLDYVLTIRNEVERER